jgi:serine/threonine protein kinase
VRVERRVQLGGEIADRLKHGLVPAEERWVTIERPDAIGAFVVLEEIGRGAAAQVFRVRRENSPGEPSPGEREVIAPEYALKLLGPDPDEPDARSAGLRREAALLASVGHPGLPAIHEVGVHDGRAYLVMDLVAGRSLSDVLTAGRLPPDRVIALGRDLAAALAAVHRRGLVHRDLKPSNIMVRPNGHARIIDFGLAARISDRTSSAIVGTLVYAAPEQTGMLRRLPDHRCDLYSLGVVLFECLAGRPPFTSLDVSELLRLHAGVQPPDLRELVPGVPEELAVLVETLLAKDPDDRYDDAVQLLEDLDLLAITLIRPSSGGDDPFAAHRVAPRWGAATRRHHLVGRSVELADLQDRWADARKGEGGVWRVSGTTGVGKSALAIALAARAEAAGALVLYGRGVLGDPAPLAPVREALATHLADVDRLPEDCRQSAWSRLARAAGPDAGLIAGLTAALPRILETDLEGPTGIGPVRGAAMPDSERFDQAVVRLLTGLATEYGSALLVLDDAQWLDAVTRRVLVRLASELDDVPLLVLLVGHTDASLPTMPGRPATAEVALEPLSDAAVADLVGTVLPGTDPRSRLAKLIAARSSGNPLVALEFLHAVADSGLLRPHWGSWILDEEGLDALDLPQDAVGLILARLQQLPAGTTDLLATAAVVGMRFSSPLVAAANALDPRDALAALGQATEHGLLEPLGDAAFGFVHEALRRALLDGLDADQAAQCHRRVAAAYRSQPVPADGYPTGQVFAVARHDLAGGLDRAPAAAFEALRQAGVLALETYAPAAAAEFLRAATQLAASNEATGDRPRLALLLGIALHRSEAFDEAGTVLTEALEETREAALRGEILAELADLHRSTGHPDLAIETVRAGLAELGAALPRRGLWLFATSLWLYLAGRMLERTGWRFGTARGAELERCRTISRLYGIAGFAALLDGSLDLMGLLSLRMPYWAHWIGAGSERSAALVGRAYLLMGMGRARAGERAFQQLRSEAAWVVPAERAVQLDAQGGAYYFFGRDDGESLADALLAHGRLLDAAAFRDGCAALALHHTNAGRSHSARQWHHRSQRRVAMAGQAARSPLHQLTSVMVEAVNGRPAQAAGLMQEIESRLPAPCPAGIALVHHLTRIIVLREQDETGAPFDRAVEAFQALQVPPRALMRMHRIVYYHVAMGRLTQARRASETERTVRLTEAAAALKVLRRFRRDGDLRALERVARADLLLQQGHPFRALRALSELDTADRHNVPMADYEGARVRARAVAVLGNSEASDRQARFALAIADDEGWPQRAGWVMDEFGQAAVRRVHASTGPRSGSGSWSATSFERGAAGTPSTASSEAGETQIQLQRQQQRLQALQQVSLAASRIVDPAVLARISLDHTIRILAAERAFLFLTDERDDLVPFLGRSADGHDISELTGYSASLVERVHRDGSPLVVTGTEQGEALGAQSVVLHGLRSIVIAPLLLEQRRLGVVYLDSQVAKGIFTADDVDILTALTTHIATSLETARAAQLAISVQTARRERDLAERLREASQALAGATTPPWSWPNCSTLQAG